MLKFTPLEFETSGRRLVCHGYAKVKIYSVGVWNFRANAKR